MTRTFGGDIAPITGTWPFRAGLWTLALAAVFVVAQIAYGQSGVVTSGGQAIPGATVTARNGEAKVTTSTDRGGHYLFANLGPGVWTFEATMIGFSAQRKTVSDPKPASVVNFQLALMQRERPGFADGAQRRREDASQAQPETLTPESTPTTPADSNEAFLVSGSLAQPFPQSARAEPGIGDRTMGEQPPLGAQIPGETGGGGPPSAAPGFGGAGGGRGRGGPGPFAGGPRGGGRFPGRGPGPPRRTEFGNRRASNPQIRGMIFGALGNAALNAKPYSISGQDVVQPAYAQARFGVILGGPFVIPKLLHNSSTFFSVNYFATRARNPFSATATVPTALERTGDFSAIPNTIYDAVTHAPFPSNVVPVSRLSPIALGLLPYIPLPNHVGATNNFMYQTSVAQDTDNLSVRLQRNIRRNDRLAYQFNYQRRDGATAQPFGFLDESDGTGWNTNLSWTHNFSAALLNTARVSVNRNSNELVPYFANGANIAAELGIAGTSSNPINFGPPNLSFTNFGALSDGTPVLTRNQSQSVNESLVWVRGSHSITIGGQFARNDLNTRTDQNGRGSMNLTGLATSVLGANGQPQPETGFDFADFLLGFPQSASIRFGEANTYFRQNVFSAFAQDEWKAGPSLTLTYGLRYEYFSPLHEKYGRMANLDIRPGFTTVAIVTPDAAGPYSGVFPTGLVDPDRNNFSPRLGLAWKIPKMRRSTLLRLGYGIYYNGQAYNQFGSRLSQQPPFAKSNSVNTSLTDVLTLADAFISTSPDEITNTYAVDRGYRTPYAQT